MRSLIIVACLMVGCVSSSPPSYNVVELEDTSPPAVTEPDTATCECFRTFCTLYNEHSGAYYKCLSAYYLCFSKSRACYSKGD
jgi:hypothetical protein